MRRGFIFISTVLLSCFTLLMIFREYHQLSFSSFEAVDVVGIDINGKTANREEFTEFLNELANRTDSIIARRIVEPNEAGQTRYTYAVYGDGKLPDNLVQASKESSENSDLISSYLIVSGSLKSQDLVDTLSQLGYSSVSFASFSLLTLLMAILVNEVSVISLVLFLLTFVSLTLIYRVKDLRSAGIKRIAGQGFLEIMYQSFLTDAKIILGTYLINALFGMIVLSILGIFQTLTISLFLLGLGLYSAALILISVSLSLVYLLGLKSSSLVEILKGRLPLKRLLAIMLIGQLLSVLVVGWTVHTILQRYRDLQVIEQGKKDWDKNADYFQLIYSYGSAFTRGQDEQEQNKQWYGFADRSLKDGSALSVKSNVRQYLNPTVSEGALLSDYVPEGNTLFVSPSYLEEQKVALTPEFMDKMKSLKEGEFGLILPEKLRDRQADLQKLYTDYMSGFASENLDSSSPRLFQVKSYLSFVKNGQDRFIYNTDSSVFLQYLTDPIMVVTIPEAMGNTLNSQLFWGTEIANSLHVKGYQEGIDLLKEEGVYQWVSYLLNNRRTYYRNLAENQNQFTFLLIGVVLGVATSMLLFDTMNILYFEQFRKEIFIKRLAGMRFEELHFYYLLAQLMVLGISVAILIYLTRNVGLSLITALVFSVNMFFILYKQNKTENKQSVTVLKGK